MTTVAAPTVVRPARPRTATGTGSWAALLRVGGLAAFGVLALMPVQMVVLFVWPLPTTVVGWFARFQENALVGLASMDALMFADYVLLALFFLALYVVIRPTSPSVATIALALELIVVATYFASAVAFEMLAASGLYAAATSEAERTIALAAGQMLLLTWQGTAFNVSYVLAGIAMLLASVVMLRDGRFGRFTAWSGIVAGTMGLVPTTVGSVGMVLGLVSLLPLWAWLALTGRTLWRMASRGAVPAGF